MYIAHVFYVQLVLYKEVTESICIMEKPLTLRAKHKNA